MTHLTPLPDPAFPAYLEAAVAGYAENNVSAGRWPAVGALARSRAEFDRMLPQGLATPDNLIFEIRAGDDEGDAQTVVGHLWVAVEWRFGGRSAFVYDLVIAAEHRRQGHARRAFLALEEAMAELGIHQIGLHVFADNPGAQALYAGLGYRVTGINMQKDLRPKARV
jgi:ribosomal protein S18 acetylase RimI-like enzyme